MKKRIMGLSLASVLAGSLAAPSSPAHAACEGLFGGRLPLGQTEANQLYEVVEGTEIVRLLDKLRTVERFLISDPAAIANA